MSDGKSQEQNLNGGESRNFDVLLREGTDLLRRGRTSEALDLLEAAYVLQPGNLDAALNFSGALILSNKFKRAVEVLEPLRDMAPDNPMVWTNLGAAYLGNPVIALDANHDKAVAAFKQALILNPAAPSVAYNIGLIYRDRREYAEAAQWFRQAVQTNPNDQHARSLLEKMLAELDEEE
jgi:tetratricopeptide (TPR) repeat protein